MSTKATLKTSYGEVSVEVKDDDLSLTSLLEFVIEPLLLAAGYAESTVRDHIPK